MQCPRQFRDGSGLTEGRTTQTPDGAGVDAGFSRDMQVHHTQAVEMSMIAWDRSIDPC
ncbi:hypothetical protein DDA93_15590 [Arthrobacter sp. Bz4]|nr:hypothetical protein DDA93_15590 [Arthrobacter sp. Bz4]